MRRRLLEAQGDEAAAAPVAKLAAMELAVDEIKIDAQFRRQPGNPGDQGLAVRFTRCYEAQHL